MRYSLAILCASLALAVGAGAAPITYVTTLSGASEFPPTGSAGTGSVTLVYDSAAHTLGVDVAFSGLTGTTLAAHVHCCVDPQAANPNAGVATQTPSFVGFPSGVTSGSYSHTFDLTDAASWNAQFITDNGGTTAGAEAALAAGLAAGDAYFNIHTSTSQGGEVRGFFTVPEPGTMALLGLGGAWLLTQRRRRSSL